MEKIYPQVVTTWKDGYKGIDYSKLTPILVEAIKEQQQIINNQQSAIGNLQTASENLKTENHNLNIQIIILNSKMGKIEEILSTGARK